MLKTAIRFNLVEGAVTLLQAMEVNDVKPEDKKAAETVSKAYKGPSGNDLSLFINLHRWFT